MTKRVLKGIWKVLTSLELGVVLVVILTAFMVVGALLPQGMDDEFYLKAWDEGTYHALRDHLPPAPFPHPRGPLGP